MDTVEQRLWLTVPERSAFVDYDALVGEHGLERAYRDKRAIVLVGRYFRVEAAKARLLEQFGR